MHDMYLSIIKKKKIPSFNRPYRPQTDPRDSPRDRLEEAGNVR